MDRLTGYLVAARDGDELALTAAVRTGQPEVRRFLRLLVDISDLDDVVQDTFVRAYRALPRFRGESSGRTWLLAIARCAAADAARSRVRQRRLRHCSEHGAGETVGADPGNEHALTDLVAGLRPDRREAFVLTQIVGCPYLEAAVICGVPVGTIRSRVARAREELVEQVHAARSA